MTGQNFIHMQIHMAGREAPQRPLFMINRIVREKGENAMKTTGKSENKYTRVITRVYDIYDREGSWHTVALLHNSLTTEKISVNVF